jgi:hypothetical protein
MFEGVFRIVLTFNNIIIEDSKIYIVSINKNFTPASIVILPRKWCNVIIWYIIYF